MSLHSDAAALAWITRRTQHGDSITITPATGDPVTVDAIVAARPDAEQAETRRHPGGGFVRGLFVIEIAVDDVATIAGTSTITISIDPDAEALPIVRIERPKTRPWLHVVHCGLRKHARSPS